MKALKCEVSGTYKNHKGEVLDYEAKGIMPFCDEGKAHQACVNRFAAMWLAKQKITVKTIRECYLDDTKEIDHDFSFIGKDIKEMTPEELQQMAVYTGIKVPAYKTTSIRNMRMKAIENYLLQVKKVPEDKVARIMELSIKDIPEFTIEENVEKLVEQKTEIQSLAESVSEYGVNIVTDAEEQSEYTMENLKDLARAKGIAFSPQIGYDKLKARVFDN